jgi:hypothetical protein
MHLTGYYPGTFATDSMVLYLDSIFTSIHEFHHTEMEIDIYPNPARDFITVKANVEAQDPITLEIFSETGKQMFTGTYIYSKGHFELQFDLSYLSEGIYLVRLMAGEVAMTEKLIVIK